MTDFEKLIELKSKLLIEGIAVDKGINFPVNTAMRNIQLYSTTVHDLTKKIPEDIVISNSCNESIICRLRYEPESRFILGKSENNYFILLDGKPIDLDVSLVKSFVLPDKIINGDGSKLGADVLGVIPSNYCFYFRNNKQCKFCEIEGTFKNKIVASNMVKRANGLAKYIADIASMNQTLNHLAITSGNLIDYDGTSKYFLNLNKQLMEHGIAKNRFYDVLITLIPPEDESLIWDLSQGVFNKIYYPIEVFDKKRFKDICPGKYEFGRDRLLKSLRIAVEAFGKGSVYTNLIYGIQSPQVNGKFNHVLENKMAIEATRALLEMGVIPAFTVYHYGGYNSIGKISLCPEGMAEFFVQWGKEVLDSGIIPDNKTSVLFGDLSLSNTMFNEGFLLALNSK